MPIYEYRCASCGFENEYLQKVSDPRLTDCPDCGSSTFEKLVSAAGFQLKGNGWYVTDFRDKGKAKPSDSKKDGAADKPAETKKEDKAAEACGTGACPSCT
ncbi:MAG TPA: zinc ribbon domain-containing protein [Burkholderiales bacterium]|nr:zinc ribbon domain-containing protein [Burkholderiales bacterium]